jgi:hypothetical protein
MSDRSARLALLAAGLRWRLGSSLAMLIIAVVAVATGAFGPIYLHSADQAVLNGALGSAPPGNVGLTLQPGVGNGSDRLMDAADRVPRAGGGRTWFGRGISTDETGVATVANEETYTADLMARSGVCAHLVIVAGRCGTQTGSVVLSARSAHELGLGVGQRIDLSVIRSSRRASLTITGLYAPNPSSRYWWGINYFGFGTGAPGKPILDEAFASFPTINTLAPASLVDRMIQVPFQAGSLAVDDTGHFETLLSQYQAAASADDRVVVGTQLPQVLAAAANDEHTSTSIVLVIDFEMLLLTVFALYFVASRTAAERLPDVQLAVLRGYRPGGTLVVALLEPVVIVLTAVPRRPPRHSSGPESARHSRCSRWAVHSSGASSASGPSRWGVEGFSVPLKPPWQRRARRIDPRRGRSPGMWPLSPSRALPSSSSPWPACPGSQAPAPIRWRRSPRAFSPWPWASWLLASFLSCCGQQSASPTIHGVSPGYWPPGAWPDDPSSRQRSCS